MDGFASLALSDKGDDAMLASSLSIPHTISGCSGVRLNFPDLLPGDLLPGDLLPGDGRSSQGPMRSAEAPLIYVSPLKIESFPDSKIPELPHWLRLPRSVQEGGREPELQQRSGGSWIYLEDSLAVRGSASSSTPAETNDPSSSAAVEWDAKKNANNNAHDYDEGKNAKSPSQNRVSPGPLQHGAPDAAAQHEAPSIHQTAPHPSVAAAAAAGGPLVGDGAARGAASSLKSPVREAGSPRDETDAKEIGANQTEAGDDDDDPVFITTIRVLGPDSAEYTMGPGEVLGVDRIGVFSCQEDYERWVADTPSVPQGD